MLLSILDFAGRFHPLLVHLPIGFLLLGITFHWLSRTNKFSVPEIVLKTIWLFGTLAAFASSVTGYLLSLSADYDSDTVNWHMWMGIGVTLISFLLFLNPTVFKRKMAFFLSVLLAVLITVTGHLGGTLTHGEGYLTGDADSEANEMVAAKNITDVQDARLYDDLVQPLLQSRCYSCHGPKKQKGNLRMDNPQLIMKGGKNGKILLAGNADESEMVIRMLLPENDKKHMPPKQKPQLTEKDIMLLHWWVQQGADFNKKVNELQQDDKIKKLLLAMEATNSPSKNETLLIHAEPVQAADPKAIKALLAKGVMVLPVANESNYLSVSFVASPIVTTEDLILLAALQKQLVSLKIGNTNIGDSALAIIGKCSQLIFLQLNHTKVTDNGMAYLSALPKLRSLNIVGTAVSAKGLFALQKLESLQSVYLYQSKVTTADWPGLKKAFPVTMLDTGGYSLQNLKSDTVFLEADIID